MSDVAIIDAYERADNGRLDSGLLPGVSGLHSTLRLMPSNHSYGSWAFLRIAAFPQNRKIPDLPSPLHTTQDVHGIVVAVRHAIELGTQMRPSNPFFGRCRVGRHGEAHVPTQGWTWTIRWKSTQRALRKAQTLEIGFFDGFL